jgi:hypothetical protein
MQKVLVHFEFPNCSARQYQNVWKDLKASGNGHPKGLIFHVGAQINDKGNFTVIDVWESEEAFRAFGKILMPAIAKQDIPLLTPRVLPLAGIYQKEFELA